MVSLALPHDSRLARDSGLRCLSETGICFGVKKKKLEQDSGKRAGMRQTAPAPQPDSWPEAEGVEGMEASEYSKLLPRVAPPMFPKAHLLYSDPGNGW